MSAQTSSFPAFSLLPLPASSSNLSIDHVMDECFRSTESIAVFVASSIANFLLLPLFLLILWLGFQQQSVVHSDIFLCHSTLMCIVSFLGFSLFFSGGNLQYHRMMWVGLYIWTITALGQHKLHLLACMERYLAVVRPITYLGLKRGGGARIRNASVGCVWLLCGAWTAVIHLSSREVYMILGYLITILNLAVLSFCNVSVLCALKRPRPGEAARTRTRERVDQTKQRAIYTITAIMGVLLAKFGGDLITNVLFSIHVTGPWELCVVLMTNIWFELPSSLVLPLLFLHREGKLRCRKPTAESP